MPEPTFDPQLARDDTEHTLLVVAIGGRDVQQPLREGDAPSRERLFSDKGSPYYAHMHGEREDLFTKPSDKLRDDEKDERARLLGARPIGEWLREHPKVPYRIPLVTALVMNNDGLQPKRIVLIASKQREDHPRAHTDTLHFAELVKKKLVEDYAIPAEDVHICLLEGKNPAHYGDTIPFERAVFKELKEKFKNATCIVGVSGGTPALTTPLIPEATDRFAFKTIACSVHPDGRVEGLDLPHDLVIRELRRTLRVLIEHHNYGAALNIWRSEGDLVDHWITVPGKRIVIDHLLLHGHFRLNQHFEKAWDAQAHFAGTLECEEKKLLEIPDYKADIKQKHYLLLKELVYSAQTFYDTQIFSMAVVRVGSFEDEIGRHLATNDGANGNEATVDMIIKPLAEKYPAVKNILNKPLRRFPGQQDWKSILSQTRTDLVDRLRYVYTDMERMLDLRNGALHAVEGITKDILNKRIPVKYREKKEPLQEWLSSLCSEVDVKIPAANPYHTLRKVLLEFIDEER